MFSYLLIHTFFAWYISRLLSWKFTGHNYLHTKLGILSLAIFILSIYIEYASKFYHYVPVIAFVICFFDSIERNRISLRSYRTLIKKEHRSFEYEAPNNLDIEIRPVSVEKKETNKIQKPATKIVHYLKDLEIEPEEKKKVQKLKTYKALKEIENEITKELRKNKSKRIATFKNWNYNFGPYPGSNDLRWPDNGPSLVPVTLDDPKSPLNFGGYKKIEELEELEMKKRTDFIGFNRQILS